MRKYNLRIRFLRSTCTVLVTWLLLSAVDSAAQASQLPASADAASPRTQTTLVRIDDAVHIIGLAEKPGRTGSIAFGEKAMTIRVHGHSIAIPLRSILAFNIVDGDRPLMRGIKGKLAESAPYGAGFVVTLIRPSAETFTLLYRDHFGAIHGCVLVLPKDTAERVVSALSGEVPLPGYPKTGDLMPLEAPDEKEIPMAAASRLTKPSVEVALPSVHADGIPSAFPAAVYENVIEELTKSGHFAHVWRAGDTRRGSNTLVLRVEIEDWKEGSPRKRGLGPFTGTTVIQSSVTLQDRSGRIVLHEKVDGKKRMKGESLEATKGLAKNVRKALTKAPDLQSNKDEGK